MKKGTSKRKFVQACISTISFPTNLSGLYEMIDKHNRYRTDLMELLDVTIADETGPWSSPKWLAKGDLMFFYHTKSAKQHIQKLLSQAEQRTDRKLIKLLKDSTVFAEKYAGTIFGIARVVDPPEYLDLDYDGHHFKGRIFAPIANVRVFENPVSIDEFGDFVRISQGTITALNKRAFDEIKALLVRNNTLPPYFQQADFSEVGFQNIDHNNWLPIITGENVRFIHETQVRSYFIDYLLSEIKDERTPLLEECQCSRQGNKTGIADYFVKIGGQWLPVEAKLNVLSEQRLSTQIKKYVDIDTFTPTKGRSKGRVFPASPLSLCLVVDNRGIYLTNDGKFSNCSADQPLWEREKLNSEMVSKIQYQLLELVK